jgi:hypothetical protein
MKNFREWLNQPNTTFTEYLHPELQEIYEYELSHGNVVDNLFFRIGLSETYIDIYFKFPLRFDSDRFINQKQITNEIVRHISYNTHFNTPWIWYSHEELHQTIMTPIEYRTLQIRKQEFQKWLSIDYYSTTIIEILLPFLIVLENFLAFYLLCCCIDAIFAIIIISFFLPSSFHSYFTIIYPKLKKNKF